MAQEKDSSLGKDFLIATTAASTVSFLYCIWLVLLGIYPGSLLEGIFLVSLFGNLIVYLAWFFILPKPDHLIPISEYRQVFKRTWDLTKTTSAICVSLGLMFCSFWGLTKPLTGELINDMSKHLIVLIIYGAILGSATSLAVRAYPRNV